MTQQSRLEDLPDEILIEICLYLSSFDILYSFGCLNQRLQRTIAEFRSQLDLTFFSLGPFQYLCSPTFLNFISERLTKLSLSNEWSLGQIELFEKSIGDICFEKKFPMLKSMILGDFMNNNVSILPKILHLEELTIEFNSYETINNTTECLINSYLFTVSNNFRKVILNCSQGIQLKRQTQPNTNLKELTIQIATVEDLLMLFTLVPCLIKLEVSIIRHAPSTFVLENQFSVDIMPKFLKELYLYTMDQQAIVFETLRLIISYIPSIEYLAFGIKTTDPDYAEAILWADLITLMPCLTTLHLSLQIELTEILFDRFGAITYDDIKQIIFDSFAENINLFSFIIYTNRQSLFIDSIPYQFNRDQSCDTSPEVVRGLCNDIKAFEQSPRRVFGLSMNGEHVSITINDYLNVIYRFPNIKWLYLESLNINEKKDEITPVVLKLKYLKNLGYLRSTRCKVDRTLFDRLFYGHERLDTLRMMYSDLIYLLRTTSPRIDGNHIKHINLYCDGADGAIRLIYLDYFILAFPLLEHLTIDVRSSKLIKKNQAKIIEELITSFKQLRSFRISCHRGTLELTRTLMVDNELKLKWLAHINAIGSYLTLQPKILALWKNDNQMMTCVQNKH